MEVILNGDQVVIGGKIVIKTALANPQPVRNVLGAGAVIALFRKDNSRRIQHFAVALLVFGLFAAQAGWGCRFFQHGAGL